MGHHFVCFFLLFLFFSCDFSSQAHKDVVRAQNYIYENKYNQAINIYLKVLAGDVSESVKLKILYQLGDIYSIHLGDIPKSISFYEEIKKVATDTDWLVKAEARLGELYYVYLMDYQRSANCYNNLVNFFPDLPEKDRYQFRLGHSYLELKKYSDAIAVFDKISKTAGHQFYEESFYYLAIVYFNEKKWTESVENLRKYLKIESRPEKLIDAKFFLGNVYETMEDLEKAYDIYYSLLADYPNTQVLKNRLKSLYTRRILRKR